ncbi:E3 ubiquitin-protein ligase UBR4-like isoform X2 [Halyomorpha halys]|uniref:E3 ubiquitin-protein ligase UBR4-like isoform X2 n=1 Tax=Halyomorpha halys TaxID=286706 RepID=UPI0034D31A4A
MLMFDKQALASGQVPVGSSGQSQEAGHYSDTTASAGGSDDEGSTAATDGSTLRTSPADQAQETDGLEAEGDVEMEGATTLHSLRLAILEKFVQHVPNLQNVSGVIAIPFMQVILMLTSDLDGEEERGKVCLENLIGAVLSLLKLNVPDTNDICTRNLHREVSLVIMRLLSVLMSRPKSSSKSGNASFVSQTTANMLLQSGVIDYCLVLLKELIPYWKNTSQEETGTSTSGTLLKPHLPSTPPDMSPFFLRQYVKGHATDVFEAYPQLLTEMALRLPYQVQKHTPTHISFPQAWFYYLCEYMMTQQTPFVRRQVRKLLLFICGNKEKYRQRRDLHALESHMKSVKQCLESREPLSYDSLVEVTEHLKACVEVGTGRTGNWRRFCLDDPSVLTFLVETSCSVEEAVAAIALQLLQCALCPTRPQQAVASTQQQVFSYYFITKTN